MLRTRPESRIRPQLHRLRSVLQELGNPQDRFPSILIVGTNGKGSTAAMLEAIARAHGQRCGLYTSPHLVRVEERVRVDGEAVSEEDFARVLSKLDRHHELTFFEAVTATALVVFAERDVDVAVLEAGMGGSWDATRLAGSEIAGLTNIGSDHQAWLGTKRAERARDKGRALEAARWAVLGPGVEDRDREAIGAPEATPAETLVRCEDLGRGLVRLAFDHTVFEAELPLVGPFQRDNLQLAVALALQAVRAGWWPGLDPASVQRAIQGLRWPGRLSTHEIAGREVLVDCAHNLEAARALAEHLDHIETRYNLVFSCLGDKPVEEIAALLRPRVGRVAICPLEDERAMPIDRLAAAFPDAVVASDPRRALDLVHDPVLAAGSIRLVGALLAHAGSFS